MERLPPSACAMQGTASLPSTPMLQVRESGDAVTSGSPWSWATPETLSCWHRRAFGRPSISSSSPFPGVCRAGGPVRHRPRRGTCGPTARHPRRGRRPRTRNTHAGLQAHGAPLPELAHRGARPRECRSGPRPRRAASGTARLLHRARARRRRHGARDGGRCRGPAPLAPSGSCGLHAPGHASRAQDARADPPARTDGCLCLRAGRDPGAHDGPGTRPGASWRSGPGPARARHGVRRAGPPRRTGPSRRVTGPAGPHARGAARGHRGADRARAARGLPPAHPVRRSLRRAVGGPSGAVAGVQPRAGERRRHEDPSHPPGARTG